MSSLENESAETEQNQETFDNSTNDYISVTSLNGYTRSSVCDWDYYYVSCCKNVWKIFVMGTLLLTLIIIPVTALDLSTDNPPATTPTNSQGDSVFVHGTATGHPQQGLNVWLLGNNYATVTNIAVGNDNTFKYEIKKAETQNLASGQYFVLVQHPMMQQFS